MPEYLKKINRSSVVQRVIDRLTQAMLSGELKPGSDDIRNFVKGVMIESYIEPGSQKVGEHIYGKSITDPCLGWDDSERLLYEMAEGL